MAVKKRRKKTSVSSKTRKAAPRKVASKPRKTARKRSSTDKKIIVINSSQGVTPMAKRRRKSASRKTAPLAGVRRRRRTRMSGLNVRAIGKNVQGQILKGVIGASAAVLTTMISAKVPVQNTKVKALIPIAVGIVLANFAKGKHGQMIEQASTGALIAGSLAIIKQFVPAFALSGEAEMYDQLAYNNGSLLGAPAEFSGSEAASQFEIDTL